jgi:hypothetical protein
MGVGVLEFPQVSNREQLLFGFATFHSVRRFVANAFFSRRQKWLHVENAFLRM